MSASSKSRLKVDLLQGHAKLVEHWAKRTKLPVEDVRRTAADVFMKQDAAREIVEEKCDRYIKKRTLDEGNIRDSFRNVWGRVSEIGTVSTTEGMAVRRVMLGSVAGPDTTYQDVRAFVGGDLSRATFREAQERHADSREKGDISILTGERQPRSDRLEVTSPKTLERISEFIMERTQPSPSETKVKHDFSRGNHKRSGVDNSLICIYPEERCVTEAVRFMMGTGRDLHRACEEYLQEAFLLQLVETNTISWASFNKLLPFNVVEQSLRCCLCVHCYKAKLITISLCAMWQTLHQGETPGSACTCECDLCKDGGCVTFLPYASPKNVVSMGNLSDLLLCPKQHLYTARDGIAVEAHRSACVSGHCPQCRRKQDRFFGCPQNRGDAQRRVHPTPTNIDSSTASPNERPPGEIRWTVFTTVDATGEATTSELSSRGGQPGQQGDGDGDDADYNPHGGANKNRQRKAVAERKGTVDDFFGEIRTIFDDFVTHRRQYKTQRVAFNEIKATLGDGQVAVVADFQERLAIREQDEVQSQHWDHEATTIFPCPIFIKWGGRVWAYSFQVLSNDKAQDTAWVQYVLSMLLNVHIPALLRKIGAHPMTRATIFTDNCAKQFKCKYHFGWVADSGVMIRDNDGVHTGERLHVEHHYFGACHGKNISDSEGGVTKTYARDQVTNQTWKVDSSRDLCDKLAKALNFIFREPTDEERDNFEASRAHGRGSENLLLTKTWIGEGHTTEQTRTSLLAKKVNTILGREFLYVDKNEVADMRDGARSRAKEVAVVGCQEVSKIVATDTPGVLAAYTLSCNCPECLAHRQDRCPLIRQGIITGPTEFSRIVGRDDEDCSDKDYALQELSQRMLAELPFGSTALIRVEPSEYHGQDMVPVIIARKAPTQWSPEYSRDGMFTHGDFMVWVYDLSQVPSSQCGQGVEYVVPDQLPDDKLRAVPLTCVAGLGQGLEGYMQRSTLPTPSERLSKMFVLRDGVIEDARSAVVRLSTNPSSAFTDFQPTALSEGDLTRAPVVRRMFADGTVFKQGFKAPVMGNGQRASWRGKVSLEAKVVAVKTDRKSRRHRYRLEWKGADAETLVLAGVPRIVDEGYIERSKKR